MSYPNPCPGCGIGMTEEEFEVHDCPRVDPYDEPPPKPTPKEEQA